MFNVYTILDTKSGWAENLYLFRSDEEARRGFGEVASDPNTKIGKYPEDYILFKVGTWSPDEMKIMDLPAFCVAKAIEFQMGDK